MVERQMGERVSALESHAANWNKQLEAYAGSFRHEIERLTKSIDKLADAERDNRKTPWATILGTVSLCLMLNGILSTNLVAPQQVEIRALNQRLDRHDKLIEDMLKKEPRRRRGVDDASNP